MNKNYGLTDAFYGNSMKHHGILGQKWGIRRFQNPDGSLTPAGRERYGKAESKANAKELLTEYKSNKFFGQPLRTTDAFKKKVYDLTSKSIDDNDLKYFKDLKEKSAEASEWEDKAFNAYHKLSEKYGIEEYEKWLAKENGRWKSAIEGVTSEKHFLERQKEGFIDISGDEMVRKKNPDVYKSYKDASELAKTLRDKEYEYCKQISDRYLGKDSRKKVGDGYRLRDVAGYTTYSYMLKNIK